MLAAIKMVYPMYPCSKSNASDETSDTESTSGDTSDEESNSSTCGCSCHAQKSERNTNNIRIGEYHCANYSYEQWIELGMPSRITLPYISRDEFNRLISLRNRSPFDVAESIELYLTGDCPMQKRLEWHAEHGGEKGIVNRSGERTKINCPDDDIPCIDDEYQLDGKPVSNPYTAAQLLNSFNPKGDIEYTSYESWMLNCTESDWTGPLVPLPRYRLYRLIAIGKASRESICKYIYGSVRSNFLYKIDNALAARQRRAEKWRRPWRKNNVL